MAALIQPSQQTVEAFRNLLVIAEGLLLQDKRDQREFGDQLPYQATKRLLMIERMGENDKIVTKYMADRDFQGSAFPLLAREIFDAVRARRAGIKYPFTE